MSDIILHLATICGILVISQLSPGPDFLLIFRTSLAYGWKEGSALGIGISVGFAIQVTLVCLLGSQILEQSWSQYILIAAALYLMYLAWMIFPRSKQSQAAQGVSAQQIGQVSDKPSVATLLLRGFICNILNAKCLLFIVGLTITGLKHYGAITWYAPVLILVLSLASALGWMMWAGLLQWQPLRQLYRQRAWLIDLCFALMLFAVAIGILLSGFGLR